MTVNLHTDNNLEDLDGWLAGVLQPTKSAPQPLALSVHGPAMPWTYDDGGRRAGGYKGQTDDCVWAIAIAAQLSYAEVYREINDFAKFERPSARRKGRRSSARTGVFKSTTRRFVEKQLGWRW